MQTTNRKIRVLVVDDSAVARSVIIQGLSASPRIEVVGYAVNAMDAKTKLQHLSPDVMTLDVEMPGINGIDFLKQLLPVHPIPVILVSSLNLRVFDALEAGAVDFVPHWLDLLRLQEWQCGWHFYIFLPQKEGQCASWHRACPVSV